MIVVAFIAFSVLALRSVSLPQRRRDGPRGLPLGGERVLAALQLLLHGRDGVRDPAPSSLNAISRPLAGGRLRVLRLELVHEGADSVAVNDRFRLNRKEGDDGTGTAAERSGVRLAI